MFVLAVALAVKELKINQQLRNIQIAIVALVVSNRLFSNLAVHDALDFIKESPEVRQGRVVYLLRSIQSFGDVRDLLSINAL